MAKEIKKKRGNHVNKSCEEEGENENMWGELRGTETWGYFLCCAEEGMFCLAFHEVML